MNSFHMQDIVFFVFESSQRRYLNNTFSLPIFFRFEDQEISFTCNPGYKSSKVSGTVTAACVKGEWVANDVFMREVMCYASDCGAEPEVTQPHATLLSQ